MMIHVRCTAMVVPYGVERANVIQVYNYPYSRDIRRYTDYIFANVQKLSRD